MKIIYLTDIHGSLSSVYSLLNETAADLYLIGGDILAMPFYSVEQSMEFYGLRDHLYRIMKEKGTASTDIHEFASETGSDTLCDPETRSLALRFLDMSSSASESMTRKYSIFERILGIKPDVPIFLVPGESDMDLERTAVSHRNIHFKTVDTGNLVVAGFGAPGFHSTLPGNSLPDPALFLESASPDIILSYYPPRGIFRPDHSETGPGSQVLRDFCDRSGVSICLSGHSHEEWGLIYSNGTLFLNPSNFGGIPDMSGGPSEGGFFFEFDHEINTVPLVCLRKIAGRRVHTLAEYRLSGSLYTESILDRKRFSALKQKVPYDSENHEYMQIPELRIIKDIRNFFRIYQTGQTDDRVRNLEDTISGLGPMSGHCALDMVGSVNMGMAQDSSDVDAVLYIRGLEECPEYGIESWPPARDAVSLIKERLSGKHGFEIIDYINLDIVEKSIRENSHECESTQRFAAYRSFCRPVNYGVIAPVEDMLNQDISYRQIVEENMGAYLRVLALTPDMHKSFDKYLTRLRSRGVKIPQPILDRITNLLQRPV